MAHQDSERHRASQPTAAGPVSGPLPEPSSSTLAGLRASGHEYRGIRAEIRANLLAMMRAGEDPFPGIVGFGQTVLPHLERALIAGHDIILLRQRAQRKTRLIPTLARLLDAWPPLLPAS